MENLNEMMARQLKEIENLIAKSDKTLARLKDIPCKSIMVSKSKGNNQYYYVDWKTNKRIYIPKKEKRALQKVAQKDYELVVNKKLREQRKILIRFMEQYDNNDVTVVYSRMCEGRKELIVPVIEPDELYRERWLEESYEPLSFNDDTEFYSSNGTRVRSKSELIIANLLEQNDIPYKYEKPLVLKGIGQVRPDFICLNTKTRKEYIWEHFGMMDNASYANKNVEKINQYQQNGYYPGVNMITSFESSRQPISSKVVKGLIGEYLT